MYGYSEIPLLQLWLPSTENKISHKILEKNKNYFGINEKCIMYVKYMFIEYQVIIMYEEGKLYLIQKEIEQAQENHIFI